VVVSGGEVNPIIGYVLYRDPVVDGASLRGGQIARGWRGLRRQVGLLLWLFWVYPLGYMASLCLCPCVLSESHVSSINQSRSASASRLEAGADLD